MPADKKELEQSAEPFLSRWARLKKQAAAAPAPPVEPAVQAVSEPVALPPVESLTPESDFSVFMGPGIQPELRQAALKKLFADPHFNLMDRLDIYIDDYTKPDPISREVIEQLAQFRSLEGVERDAPQPAASEQGQVAEPQCAAAASLPDQTPDTGSSSAHPMVSGGGSETTPVPDTMSPSPAVSGQDVATVRQG